MKYHLNVGGRPACDFRLIVGTLYRVHFHKLLKHSAFGDACKKCLKIGQNGGSKLKSTEKWKQGSWTEATCPYCDMLICKDGLLTKMKCNYCKRTFLLEKKRVILSPKRRGKISKRQAATAVKKVMAMRK